MPLHAQVLHGDSRAQNMGRVGIIGGGIAGMAAAHFLAEAGAAVTLYESSDQFGGLGTFFRYRDMYLERFYHCMLPSDNDLLDLLHALHIADRVYWRPAAFGYMSQGRLYGLNTPSELLRFHPLPLLDRFRVGLTAIYGSMVSAKGLDDITCEAWLTKLSGRRAFDMFWKPMLQAKFGDSYHEVPALWFWRRFNREKGTKKEVKGYIRGGYKCITDCLVASLQKRGACLYLNAPIEAIDLDESGQPVLTVCGQPETFDRVIITTPPPLLRQIAHNGRLANWLRQMDDSIDAQGVVNVVLFLRRGLTNKYWIAAIDDHVPFHGIVESSTLLAPEDTGGLHLVYLTRYVHRTDPLFTRSEVEIAREYVDALKMMFPSLREADIVESFTFKAPFVEPLYTRGYLQHKLPTELVPGRVYLATSTQVYPEIPSWNSSVGLAKQVVHLLTGSD
jgi:protoporphyrinogen oxidase